MRTFDEIIGYVKITYPELGDISGMKLCMRIACEEALDLAAEKAQVEFEEPEEEINDYGERTWAANPIVDKESILKLKEQLK